MKEPKKLPTDANQRAYEIVRLSTEEADEPETPGSAKEKPTERSAISEYLATIGRKGGLVGGVVRAKKLTAKRRSDIAKKAASARWQKK